MSDLIVEWRKQDWRQITNTRTDAASGNKRQYSTIRLDWTGSISPTCWIETTSSHFSLSTGIHCSMDHVSPKPGIQICCRLPNLLRNQRPRVNLPVQPIVSKAGERLHYYKYALYNCLNFQSNRIAVPVVLPLAFVPNSLSVHLPLTNRFCDCCAATCLSFCRIRRIVERQRSLERLLQSNISVPH
jgi:hypothetical protein